MIYGYLRVSSDKQDIESQKLGVVDFAGKRGWSIEKFISDEGVSGGKNPDKRKLGPLLTSLQKGDIVICSEISRLGRDLYMIMDILHFCMNRGCVIYTVKDNFVLGDDMQSKVLAFAFGLSAEIERQMIRQRTREGLRLRMQKGVLVGRPIGARSREEALRYYKWKDKFRQMVEWGMTQRQIAKVIGCTRNTVDSLTVRWGFDKLEGCAMHPDWVRKREERKGEIRYKESSYSVVNLDRELITHLIEEDLTIPEIAERIHEYTYEQVYDTILCDPEFNTLYRAHAQKELVKSHKRKKGYGDEH